MKRLIFDIETLPADDSKREGLKYLFGRKLEKKQKVQEVSEDVLMEEDRDAMFEDFIKGTSFDGAFGRVLCIAYAVNDDETRVLCNPDNEKKTLEDFWFVAGQCDQFVGHNVMDFDLRFLLQRSVILGVKPSWNRFTELGKKPWEMGKYLSFARYSNLPIFDTMYEWTNWGNSRQGSGLEHIAIAMGLETPKQGIDGSQVNDFYKAGKVDEICEYCKRDVETTRAVFKKMIYADRL